MVKKFTDEANRAGPGKRAAIRALQAWQYLIGKASNRQIIRYKELRDLMGYPNDRPLTQILECVMRYCEQHKLPPLTTIVVNQQGVPGEGFSEVERRREDVFDYAWFKDLPPEVAELQDAATIGRRITTRVEPPVEQC